MQEGRRYKMKNQEKTKPLSRLSLSAIFTVLVSAIVLITSIVTVLMFIGVYRDEVEQNAVTSSEQDRFPCRPDHHQ